LDTGLLNVKYSSQVGDTNINIAIDNTIRHTPSLGGIGAGNILTIGAGVSEAMEETNRRHEITLIIVYGVNKPLRDVKELESIEVVKVAAMGLFGISEAEKGQFILRTKVNGKDEQLDEAKTVEHYHLHNDHKVTLAAGTPFGSA
jgi:hypothetical protein